MTAAGWAQLIALIAVIGATAPLLGRYIANVYEGGPSRLDRVFRPVERVIYRACRIDPRPFSDMAPPPCRACWRGSDCSNAMEPI